MPPITVQSEERRKHPKGEKYELISKVAYLIGVPYWVFENEFESPRIDIYQELNQNKHARIIRNLCIVRTAIERFFMQKQRICVALYFVGCLVIVSGLLYHYLVRMIPSERRSPFGRVF